MDGGIPNYGASLPKEYQSQSAGEIKALGISKKFRFLILAPSNSGKTNLLFHMLKSSPNVFAHLHIIARNPDQELYDYLRDKLAGFVTFYDPDDIPPVNKIRKSKTSEGTELVVFDDLSSERILQKNVISQFFIRGRHMGLSSIMLVHSYFALDKLIRLNSEYIAILKANSKRDLKMILKDFNIPISENDFYEAYKQATASKGQMLLIDSVKDELRQNFDTIFDPKTLETKKRSSS